jgi:branched-chain amino acid transport system ATP-binding protein
MSAEVISADSVVSGYGKKAVLREVTVSIGQGEIVAIVGHNGAGKSTLLRVLFGLLPIWSGTVKVDGLSTDDLRPRDLLRSGICYVPQGNRVFSALTVRENLELVGLILEDRRRFKKKMERILGVFPSLSPHLKQRAGTLSGGEKQVLALAKALLLSPRLLFLDEPTLGLAPPLVRKTLELVKDLSANEGFAAVLVEQRVREVIAIAERVYVLRNGTVSFSGPSASLQDPEKLREVYF